MPADLSITITGVDKLVAKFGRVQAVQILHAPMQRATDRLWHYMIKYPSRKVNRPGYKRGSGPIDKSGKVIRFTSERLGDKWTREITSIPGGLQGKVGNNVSYAPLVQSQMFQAAVHKAYWKNTDINAIRTNRAAIVKDFNAEIRRALR